MNETQAEWLREARYLIDRIGREMEREGPVMNESGQRAALRCVQNALDVLTTCVSQQAVVTIREPRVVGIEEVQ